MRTVIHILLVLISLGLLYALYATIKEPIQFQSQRNMRKKAVVEKLKDIREAQKLYRGMTDTFATSFADLESGLKNGQFKIIKVLGDRDAIGGGTVSYDTIMVSAIDSINSLGLDISNLSKIPYSEKEFSLVANQIEQQSITVPVVEVGAKWSDFMGEFGDARFSLYDKMYDPSNMLKFGSKTSPSLAGNWE